MQQSKQCLSLNIGKQQSRRLKLNIMKTYNVQFNDSENSNDKGFAMSLEEAKDYITENNGTNESYFEDYKGGMVSVVDNETGETVHEEEVR